MAETNLAFSKVVSTPTESAWSQAYSAGSLFAAFSLESGTPNANEDLTNIGKELISTFESEFFTLENKDLESIKQAITTTISRISQDIKVSIVVCFLSEDVLYLFASGGGKAILKRDEKIGTVLEGNEGENIKSASGYVENGDIIVLQTNQFLNIISPSILASALDSKIPEEISEELAPQVHERTEGGASSVILVYNKEQLKEGAAMPPAQETQEVKMGDEKVTSETSEENREKKDEEEKTDDDTTLNQNLGDKTPTPPLTEPFAATTGDQSMSKTDDEETDAKPTHKSRRKLSSGLFSLSFLNRFKNKIPKSRRTLLFVAIILIVLIIAVSFLALNNRGTLPSNFDEIYAEASTKYEEGINLKDLNPSLAQDSFREAQQILESNAGTFEDGSQEDQQIEELLSKVTIEITGDGGTIKVSEVTTDESRILSIAIDNPNASYLTENNSFIHYITSKKVVRVDKGNSEEEDLIESGFTDEAGLGTFGSNVYVLDKKTGIIKFVPTEDGYSDTDYLKGDSPDFSEAIDLAIDGSVYVLESNGTVTKFLRGERQDFEIKGLTKPLASPTRIFTNEDTDNLYILDNGNSRIVVLDKNGAFVNSFTSDIIKGAKEIDVDETGGKVFVLSNNKIYQIDIN